MHGSHYQMILHETWILRWWYMWDDNEWYTTCTTCFVLPLVFSDFWSFHPANQNTKPSISIAEPFIFKNGYPCTYTYEFVFFFLPYNQTFLLTLSTSVISDHNYVNNQSLKFLILNHTTKTLKDIEQYVKEGKIQIFFFAKA